MRSVRTKAGVEQFREVVKAKFSLWAESHECWSDAGRRNTFTGLVRLAVGMSVFSGEAEHGGMAALVLGPPATSTAIQMVGRPPEQPGRPFPTIGFSPRRGARSLRRLVG